MDYRHCGKDKKKGRNEGEGGSEWVLFRYWWRQNCDRVEDIDSLGALVLLVPLYSTSQPWWWGVLCAYWVVRVPRLLFRPAPPMVPSVSSCHIQDLGSFLSLSSVGTPLALQAWCPWWFPLPLLRLWREKVHTDNLVLFSDLHNELLLITLCTCQMSVFSQYSPLNPHTTFVEGLQVIRWLGFRLGLSSCGQLGSLCRLVWAKIPLEGMDTYWSNWRRHSS